MRWRAAFSSVVWSAVWLKALLVLLAVGGRPPVVGASPLHQGEHLALHYRGEFRSLFSTAHLPAVRQTDLSESPSGVESFARQALRWELWGSATAFVVFEVAYEHELVARSSHAGLLPTIARPAARPAVFLGLDWTPHFSDGFVWRHRFDRLNTTLRLPWLHGMRLTVGRMAEGFGFGNIWQPANRISPPRPVEMMRRHAPGVDAVRLAVSLAPLTELRLLVVPTTRQEELMALLRFEMSLGPVDLAATIGDDHHRFLSGLGARAGFGKIQVEGEALYLHDPSGTDHAQAVLGLSAALPLTMVGTLEFGYDGSGAAGAGGYGALWESAEWQGGRRVGVGRYYAGFILGARPLPRLTLEGRSILNLGDQSALVAAHLGFGVSDAAWLRFSAAMPIGSVGGERPGSEFGITPYLYVIDLTMHF